uniref:Uncharacterized protein n=1 Tax=Chromera velia CCMP2878 TaxID=1169474 RepID=A0A0G4HFA8_9ALVE|eukprot:Cvel_26988.t1-p1 / transcript=Cvel_26988.t1 / gene=Cvel_26988 / organism=Chromera_velia_CCMP2878 / gene_product=hypothetical protein / transcript_product=hypothetical protein / location=Cvel_scaffold3296:11965-14608(+) / protein_length=83 / sequence_SO=supercontig / SO=protein_coding / is_pseudo=false
MSAGRPTCCSYFDDPEKQRGLSGDAIKQGDLLLTKTDDEDGPTSFGIGKGSPERWRSRRREDRCARHELRSSVRHQTVFRAIF